MTDDPSDEPFPTAPNMPHARDLTWDSEHYSAAQLRELVDLLPIADSRTAEAYRLALHVAVGMLRERTLEIETLNTRLNIWRRRALGQDAADE